MPRGKFFLTQVAPREMMSYVGATLFLPTCPVRIKQIIPRGTDFQVTFYMGDSTEEQIKYSLRGFYKPVFFNMSTAATEEMKFLPVRTSDFRLVGKYLLKKDKYFIDLPKPKETWWKEVREVKLPLNAFEEIYFPEVKLEPWL